MENDVIEKKEEIFKKKESILGYFLFLSQIVLFIFLKVMLYFFTDSLCPIVNLGDVSIVPKSEILCVFSAIALPLFILVSIVSMFYFLGTKEKYRYSKRLFWITLLVLFLIGF